MIEKISICAVNESGETITLGESIIKVSSGLDVGFGDLIAAINWDIQTIADQEIRTTEKFFFALNLKNYLKEMKENGNRTAN